MVGRGVAGVGVAVAAVAVAVLHVVGAGTVDPVAQTISDYVVLPDGAALLALAAAGLITAGFAGAVSLNATARRLLLLWGAAVLLVAVFPTNLPGQPADVSALVHRWAGALVFALPPLAGLVGARSAGPRRGPLLAASLAAAVAAGAFLLAHAPHVLAGADVVPWLGIVERVAYAALLVQLIVFAAPGAVGPAAAVSPAAAVPSARRAPATRPGTVGDAPAGTPASMVPPSSTGDTPAADAPPAPVALAMAAIAAPDGPVAAAATAEHPVPVAVRTTDVTTPHVGPVGGGTA